MIDKQIIIHDKLKESGVFQQVLDIIRKGGHSEASFLETNFAITVILSMIETEISKLKQKDFLKIAPLLVAVKTIGKELESKFMILDKLSIKKGDDYWRMKDEVSRVKKSLRENGKNYKNFQNFQNGLMEKENYN